MNVMQDITIDVLKPRQTVIHVVQEDSTRKIRLTLLKNNLPFDISQDLDAGETVYGFVEFRKADGHGGMYDTTSLGDPAVELEDAETATNVWIVNLDGNCFTCPGWAQINVRFETEDGKRIHTFRIMVDVEPTASSDTESTDWGELNSIADMKAAITSMFEETMSVEAKQALLNLLSHVAYTDEHGQDYYDALEAELFRTAELVSISAVFDQGSAVIYDTDDLDTLRQYLTVTATYEDLSEREITGYTLSGTLTVGTSTITVAYGGKTVTFEVTVSDFMLNDILTLDGIQNTRSGHNASATTWEDLSGNGNDFAKISGASNVVWENDSATFDATNRLLGLDKDLFNGLTNLSIEIVVNITGRGSTADGSASVGYAFTNRTSENRTDGFRIYSYVSSNGEGMNGTYASTGLGYFGDFATIDIRHIVFVFTSTGETTYVDGEVANTKTLTFPSGSAMTSFRIGGSATPGAYFNGKIYRIGISSTAMTAQEVAERYSFMKNRFGF